MKKKQHFADQQWSVIKKLFLVMKLTSFLLFLSVVAMASGTYGQVTRFDLNVKELNVVQVFDEIERVTEFGFLFKTDQLDLNQHFSINMKDASIDQILSQVLDINHHKYTVIDRNIVITTVDGNAIQDGKSKSISGKVTDSTGASLPGVSVVVKGTTTGVITDNSGNYALSNIPENATLQFSFVGMKTQEVATIDKTTINVSLIEQSIGLEEVLAVGYGTTTKTKLVSSVTKVETAGLANSPYTSSVSGLAGRAAGLFVSESGGIYGSLPTISIRGGGEPTYVIDGIKSTKEILALIPPSDIEDISILKDASASAVYGFDSSNGVILVTTKHAGKGKMKIAFGTDFSFQTNPLKPTLMQAYDKALFDNALSFNDGRGPVVDATTLNILKNNLDPVRYPRNDPYNQLIKKYAGQQRHSLTLSSSENNTDIYVSLNYFNQDAIYKIGNNGLDRYSLRFNVAHKFDKIGLTASSGVNISRQTLENPPGDEWNLWIGVLHSRPGTAFFNPAGNYYGEGNPMAMLDSRAGYAKNEQTYATTDLTLKWDVPFVTGLSLKAVGFYKMDYSLNKTWTSGFRNSAPLYNWENIPSDMGLPALNENTGRLNNYTLEGHINYNRTFLKDHTVELTGVVIKSADRYDYFSASRSNYISSAVDQLFAGNPAGQLNNGSAAESGRLGYVGRFKYDYKSKYIMEASFRYDGNDNFPSEKRWGLFPAISLGWNLSNENFVKPYLDKIGLNSLKLRASVGKLGSQGQVGRFGYIPAYSLNNSSYYIDGQWKGSFVEGPLVSRNLSWQTTKSENVGFDFAFLKNKISGTLDWFYYRTTGFIGSPATGYTTPLGASLPQINTSSAFRRGGFEASLAYHTKVKGVQINLGGNISYFDQLWEKNDAENIVNLKNPYTRTTQQTDYYTVGYQDLGYFQSTTQIINSPRLLSATQTYAGDLSYSDTNGDGKIDQNDQRRIGKGSFPHVTYGSSLNASYKGFSLDALFQGTSNRQMYLTSRWWMDGPNATSYTIMNDYWRADNPNALFPRESSALSNVNGSNNVATSSFWLKDAWYVRLKSLSISYDLKSSVLKKANFIGSCSLILSGTNLLTISPVTKYLIDPEIADYGSTSYPVMRTYNLGLRVIF